METIQLTDSNQEEAARRAAEVVRGGGLVLYPTDTLYGLGTDALSSAAVAKIYQVKGREEGKPIHAIVSDVEVADRFGEVTPYARVLAEKLGGKATLIIKKREYNTGVFAGIDTFGFRIPDNTFCTAMCRAYGGPITATSANKSGEITPRTVGAILAQLGEAAEKIDLIVDAGELSASKPSSVVDVRTSEPEIIREGAVSAETIRSVVSL